MPSEYQLPHVPGYEVFQSLKMHFCLLPPPKQSMTNHGWEMSLLPFASNSVSEEKSLRIEILASASYEMPDFICICTNMKLDVLFITYTLTSKRI